MLLFEIANPTTIEMAAISIPESLGLLIFGLLLAAIAFTLRAMLARAEASKAEKK